MCALWLVEDCVICRDLAFQQLFNVVGTFINHDICYYSGKAERVRNKTLSICFLPQLISTSNKTILSVCDQGYDMLTRKKVVCTLIHIGKLWLKITSREMIMAGALKIKLATSRFVNVSEAVITH